MAFRHVFVTGGTGYLGRPLIRELLTRGHTVRALVRPGSEKKLPAGVKPFTGDALDSSSFGHVVAPADTFVHLVGTPHPSPWKGREFYDVDLRSIRAAVQAAVAGGVRHIVYVSVAHPAPVMPEYIAARSAGEASIRESRIPATILRPWYVLGPGHRWPSMVAALVEAVERPTAGLRIVGVPEIRAAGAA
jgi:uncharacterized protein YbjT (DUF2867 family)